MKQKRTEQGLAVTPEARAFLESHFCEENGGKPPETPIRLCCEMRRGSLMPQFHKKAGMLEGEDTVVSIGSLTLLCNFNRHPELEGITVALRDRIVVLVPLQGAVALA